MAETHATDSYAKPVTPGQGKCWCGKPGSYMEFPEFSSPITLCLSHAPQNEVRQIRGAIYGPKVERLPNLQPSDRPQEQIEVGLVPIPRFLKRWLFQVFAGTDHA